jgi:L-2-hydroxyglutarate oxidase LhgO
VRAQSVRLNGELVDDFSIGGSGRILHVRNAPSPAATASLAIGRELAELAERRFDLG